MMTQSYKVHRRNGAVHIKIDITLPENTTHAEKYDIKNIKAKLEQNLPWMGKHLYSYGDYDSHYSIQLFSDSLIALGRGLIRWDNVVGGVKNGRRAIAAGIALKRAYDYCITQTPSYKHHLSRMRRKTTNLKHGMKRWDVYAYCANAMNMDPDIYEKKMYQIIVKKSKREQENLINDAWAYIVKYIPTFWD